MGSAWGSGISSDPLLHAVFLAALGALGAALLLIGWILVLRLAGGAARAGAALVTDKWRPRFAAALYDDGASSPEPASAREARPVLRLFVQVSLSLQGAAAARLARYGRECGLRNLALHLLTRRSTRDRLLAIEALGCLGQAAAVDDLLPVSAEANPIVSLAAARAMLRLDAERTAERVIALAMERPDWPVARLLPILQAAGRPAAMAVRDVLERLPRRALLRPLALSQVLPAPASAPTVRRVLASDPEPELMIAALKLLQDPRDADFARRAVDHGDWAVRVAAVRALARVATEADLPRLREALGDPVWWVRQRAAEAIVRMPFLSLGQLEALRDAVPDRFAGDALARAMAERAFR
jgi:HEAT repeat protein